MVYVCDWDAGRLQQHRGSAMLLDIMHFHTFCLDLLIKIDSSKPRLLSCCMHALR